MKTIRLFIFAILVIFGSQCSQNSRQLAVATTDPLDKWNEGPAKESILTFMKTITDSTNPGYVPVPDRVAVFDMDGTILLEKPNFVLFDFITGIVLEQIDRNPTLKQRQPFKAFYEKDWGYFEKLDLYGEQGLYSILTDATEGYTEDGYRKAVLEYFSTVKDKRYQKSYDKLVYAPIVQLIRCLQENRFEVYIVSGSDPEFTRAFSENAINIPVQNVIGTTVLTQWIQTDTGSYFKRVHKLVEPVNDEAGKPVNILNKIGIVPVLAVGNSYGDYAMLEYSKNAPLSLQMIVNHDDSIREYYYDTEKMKKSCKDNKWQEISMKKDFKVIFRD